MKTEPIFDKITVEVYMQKHIDVDIDIEDVIDTINNNPQRYKWNYIARIINSIDTNIDKLTESERTMIVNYLTEKLKKFQS